MDDHIAPRAGSNSQPKAYRPPEPIPKQRREQIAQEVAALLSNWIQFPSENDRLFFRQLETIFAGYPPSVTAAVTSPLTGMQRDPKYQGKRPDTPQIVAELNREMRIFNENAARQQVKRITREQEERGERPPLDPIRLAYWFNKDPAAPVDPVPPLTAPRRRREGFRPLSELMTEYGVTQEQINAIPSRKTG